MKDSAQWSKWRCADALREQVRDLHDSVSLQVENVLELIGQLEQHVLLLGPVRHFALQRFDANDPERRLVLSSPPILLTSRDSSRASLPLESTGSSNDFRARCIAGGRISFNDAPGQNGIDVGEQLGIAEPELALPRQVHEYDHPDFKLVAVLGIEGLVDRSGQ